MIDPADTELLTGGEKVTERWWIDAARDRDVYELRVVRYHEPVQNREDGDRWVNWSEYLGEDCRWHVSDPGAFIPATMTLRGELVHVLANLDGLLDRDDIAVALNRLCARILMSVVAREAAGDDATEGSGRTRP